MQGFCRWREKLIAERSPDQEVQWVWTNLPQPSICALSLFPKWDTSSSEGTAEPGACSQLAGSLGHLARRPLYSGSLRAPILRRLLAGHTVPEPNELLRLVMQLVLGSCAA